jgi:ATP diphosphatase
MSTIEGLLDIMRCLRDAQRGCPWDRQQNYVSIVPHTLEEAYEVADAIERGALDELPGELGDLLFQVVFYCQLAEEEGRFCWNDVVRGISEKLVRRHPHVFAAAVIADAEAQTQAWERLKMEERTELNRRCQSSLLDGVIDGLPALTRALKLQKRAALAHFDWPDIGPVFGAVAQELDELREVSLLVGQTDKIEEELGDLLFSCVNLARFLHADPEQALRRATRKFEMRFHFIEAQLARRGKSPTESNMEEMNELWDEAKRHERQR